MLLRLYLKFFAAAGRVLKRSRVKRIVLGCANPAGLGAGLYSPDADDL